MKNHALKKINVYNYIYSAIASGKYPMGSSVSDAEIAKELNISRSPVREALKKLEGEGIIINYPNRGRFVVNFTVQDISELHDLRSILEVYAVEFVIENLNRQAFEEIENEFKKLDQSSPVVSFHKANQKLHNMIIRGSGNSRLEVLYNMLNTQIAILNVLSTDSPRDFVQSREEHLAIIQSILLSDYDSAKKNIIKHIDNIKENTIKRFLFY